MTRLAAAFLIAVILAGGLAACGKKGSLEPPPGSTYPQRYPKE